jgi:hypothetical protein
VKHLALVYFCYKCGAWISIHPEIHGMQCLVVAVIKGLNLPVLFLEEEFIQL